MQNTLFYSPLNKNADCTLVSTLISKKALLVSGYCDHEKIYEDFKCLEWSHSLARKVCNQDFYNSAFSDEEKDWLVAKKIEEGGN
ncbi:hypothetical protein IJ425_04430, partial [bacterium]|nr:hypothetical protein [bacterium]